MKGPWGRASRGSGQGRWGAGERHPRSKLGKKTVGMETSVVVIDGCSDITGHADMFKIHQGGPSSVSFFSFSFFFFVFFIVESHGAARAGADGNFLFYREGAK